MKSRFSTALCVGASLTGTHYAFSGNSSYRRHINTTKEKLRTQLRKVEEKYPPFGVIGSAVSVNLAMTCGPLSKIPFRLKFLPGLLLHFGLINNYHRFLSAPVNAIQDVPFSQIPYLTSQISWRSSNFERLFGVCYGATYTWGEYEVAGKNLMAELKKPVFFINDSLLERIDTLQEKKGTFYIPGNTICWPLPSVSHPNIDNVTAKIVNKAVKNPGKLYNLSFFDHPSSGHVIGVMASTIENKTVIKYFDSNLREAAFQDKDAAQKSLALTLRYGGYAGMFHGKVKKNVERVTKSELGYDESFAFIKERKIS